MFLLMFLVLSVTVNIYGQDAKKTNNMYYQIPVDVKGGGYDISIPPLDLGCKLNCKISNFDVVMNIELNKEYGHYNIDLSDRGITEIISFEGEACKKIEVLSLDQKLKMK